MFFRIALSFQSNPSALKFSSWPRPQSKYAGSFSHYLACLSVCRKELSSWSDKWEVWSSRWVWVSTYPGPRCVPNGVHDPSRMLNHHLSYSQPPQGMLPAWVTWLKPVNGRNGNVLNIWCPSSPLNDSIWQKRGSDKFMLGFGLFNDLIIEGKSFNSGQFSSIQEQYWYTSVKN